MNNKIKVVLIQSYNTPYRNNLFNKISNIEDIDLNLVYLEKKTEDRKWKDELVSDFKEFNVKCTSKKISYEKNITRVDILDLIKIVNQIKPDVIISQLSKYTIILKYVFFWRSVRLIHWSESTLITEKGNNWYNKIYLKWNLNMPKAFLFPGSLAKLYHKNCGFQVNEENVFFAPNSVDSLFNIEKKYIKLLFEERKKLKFLFVGSFISLKSFDTLNEAFDILLNKYPDIEFHIAGDGPLKPLDRAINHGFLTKEQAAELYRQSHVFIMPSLWDCSPLSVVEAAKCGCILLVSDGVGNFPELVTENGEVFKRGEIEAIIKAVEKIMEKSTDDLIKMAELSVQLSSTISHDNTSRAFYNAINFVMKV